MTVLLADIRGETEVEQAFAAGAAYVRLRGSSSLLSRDGEVAVLPLDPARWEEGLVAAGPRTVLLLDSDRHPLLTHLPFEEAARFARLCRERGSPFGFAGALEAPDIPRLLPLKPDLLAFGSALQREGAFDPARCRALAAALGGERPGRRGEAAPDRVFVRGLVVEMEVGAYGSERGRRQRVRFDVEAELAPPVARPFGMEDVFSYDRILDAARALAARGHTDLVETLAEDLAAELLTENWLEAVVIRVEKLDLGSFAAGVEIRRMRS